VRDPRVAEYVMFTEATAWEFVADELEAGCAIDVVILNEPLGKQGFVLKLFGGDGAPQIYVKLQMGPGFVFGRSFHYSYDKDSKIN
jgi:hypothetical protein